MFEQELLTLIGSMQTQIANQIKVEAEKRGLSGAVFVLGTDADDRTLFDLALPTLVTIGSKLSFLDAYQQDKSYIAVAAARLARIIHNFYINVQWRKLEMIKETPNFGGAMFAKYGCQFFIALATNNEEADDDLAIIKEVLVNQGSMEY